MRADSVVGVEAAAFVMILDIKDSRAVGVLVGGVLVVALFQVVLAIHLVAMMLHSHAPAAILAPVEAVYQAHGVIQKAVMGHHRHAHVPILARVEEAYQEQRVIRKVVQELLRPAAIPVEGVTLFLGLPVPKHRGRIHIIRAPVVAAFPALRAP